MVRFNVSTAREGVVPVAEGRVQLDARECQRALLGLQGDSRLASVHFTIVST